MILSKSMKMAVENKTFSGENELSGFVEMNRFLESLRFERNLSQNTIRNYRIDILDYLRWAQRMDLDPFRLSHKQMRRYLAEMDAAQYARKTINRRLSAIKTFFSWLNSEGIISQDPASALQGPKNPKALPKVIKPKDMCRFLSVHAKRDADGNLRDQSIEDIRDQAILELLYACGARVSEVANLKLEDIDVRQKQVKVLGKGSKERIIPIHDLAIDSINAYVLYGRPKLLGGKTSDYLFVSTRGNRFSDQAIRRMFKKTLAAAGLDENLSPHAMRHTFATDVLSGGADLRSVQEMLGHVSLSTTQIYTHIAADRLKEAHKQSHPRG